MVFPVNVHAVPICVLVQVEQQPATVPGIPQPGKNRVAHLIQMRQRYVGLAREISLFHQPVRKHVIAAEQDKAVIRQRQVSGPRDESRKRIHRYHRGQNAAETFAFPDGRPDGNNGGPDLLDPYRFAPVRLVLCPGFRNCANVFDARIQRIRRQNAAGAAHPNGRSVGIYKGHPENLVRSRHCRQQRFAEGIGVVDVDLAGIDQPGDVFVQFPDRRQPPPGFAHQRQHGELCVFRQQFARVLLRAPHRYALDQNHPDQDQRAEAEHERRRERRFYAAAFRPPRGRRKIILHHAGTLSA